MKFTLALIAGLVATGYAAPGKRSVDLSLIPEPGITAGKANPLTNGADCLGNNDTPIPCKCPPSREDLAAKVALFDSQGKAQITDFKFPSDPADQSLATRKTRIDMLIIALQNFDNTEPGKGCPAAAAAPDYVKLQTDLGAQLAAGGK